jgi:cell division protein FtsL
MYVFLFSLLMILYVANVIKVKSLLKEERKLSKHLEKIENENQLLKTEINRLESPERITSVATKKLGMVKPDTPPKVIAAK